MSDSGTVASIVAGSGLRRANASQRSSVDTPCEFADTASAITAQVDYFLTTDKALLRKMQTDTRIRVLDPVDFVRMDNRDEDEN